MSIEKLSTNASLKDVIDKFEELSLQDFSNINVITVNELPNEVKEGQIVIITNNIPSMIYFDYNSDNINPNENDIFICIDETKRRKFSITSKNVNLSTFVCSTLQFVGDVWVNIDSYIGIEGEWMPISPRNLSIFSSGALNAEAGNFELQKLTNSNASYGVNSTHATINMSAGSMAAQSVQLTHTDLIDLSMYGTLSVDIYSVLTGGKSPGGHYADVSIMVLSSSNSVVARTDMRLAASSYAKHELSRDFRTLDISNINGLYKVAIYVMVYNPLSNTISSSTQIYQIDLKEG